MTYQETDVKKKSREDRIAAFFAAHPSLVGRTTFHLTSVGDAPFATIEEEPLTDAGLAAMLEA